MKETYPNAHWGLYRIMTFYMLSLRIICFSDSITFCHGYKQYCYDGRDLNQIKLLHTGDALVEKFALCHVKILQ